jgi:hypothetical protein
MLFLVNQALQLPNVDDFGWTSTSAHAISGMIPWLGRTRIRDDARLNIFIAHLAGSELVDLEPLMKSHHFRSVELDVSRQALFEMLLHVTSVPTLILLDIPVISILRLLRSRSIPLRLCFLLDGCPLEPPMAGLPTQPPESEILLWDMFQQLVNQVKQTKLGFEHSIWLQRNFDSNASGVSSTFDWKWADQESEERDWVARVLYFAMRLHKKGIQVFDMNGKDSHSMV